MLLPRANVSVAPEPGCDLHRQACAASLPDGGRIELSILPRPIPMLKTLQVHVTMQGLAADAVELDFSGVDMDMGFNRARLAATGTGAYRGEAALAVCTTGTMHWQATLLIDSGRRRIAVPFRFASHPQAMRP